MGGEQFVQNAIVVACSAGMFIALWCILGNYLFKPYIALIEMREARTTGDERKAHELIAISEEVRGQIEEQLKETRLQGLAARDASVQRARERARVITDDAGARARRELETARDEIATVRSEAEREMAGQAQGIADSLLTRVLAERGTQTIH